MGTTDSSDDDHPTQNAGNKASEQGNQSKPGITSVLAEHWAYPPECRYKVSCKTEKDWWEKRKPFIELTGVLLLAIYTGYTAYMYYANRDAANAARSAADTAARQFTATINHFHLDQRAWVAAVDVRGTPEIGKPFDINITAKNTGKTFAKEFRMVTVVESRPRNGRPDFSKEYGKEAQSGAVSVLAPNGEYVSTVNPIQNSANVSEGDLKLIASKTFSLFVHGRITYKDVFKCPHWTTFCIQLRHDRPSFTSCSEHNDVDENTCDVQ